MNIRNESQFTDALDGDFAWRIKDISTFKRLISQSSGSVQQLYIRSATTICYAHWEGFVKNSAITYLEYILSKNLRYSDVLPCFLIFGVRKELDTMTTSKKHIALESAVKAILQQHGKAISFRPSNYVYTGSNLSSDIFSHLINSIGIDDNLFSLKYNFIDEILLKRRNKVAHGEYISIDQGNCVAMIEEINGLLRLFKNTIQNSGVRQTFLLTNQI